METFEFGYPRECAICNSSNGFSGNLKVKPYFQKGTMNKSVMLIGQDPTIYNNPDRVKYVLMLDQENGQLKRWLREDVFDQAIFDSVKLYATNLVKCTLNAPPGTNSKDKTILQSCFVKCKSYLVKEIELFKPDLIITFGEPTHKLFSTLIDNSASHVYTMQNDFIGQFQEVTLNGLNFLYSPCLHIKTFRVAKVYGEKIKLFKGSLAAVLTDKKTGI